MMNEYFQHRMGAKKVREIASAIVVFGALTCFCLPVAAAASPGKAPTMAIEDRSPHLKPVPAEDTARYAAWLVQQHKKIQGKPREDVSLRVGDWGFFQQELRPGYFWDRAAIDRSGHVVTHVEKGDWFALLSTPGLDASSALKRIAWLFPATGIETATPQMAHGGKITAPTLNAKDGTIVFQGWFALWRGEFPPDMDDPMRITIKTTASSAKLTIEPVKNIQ